MAGWVYVVESKLNSKKIKIGGTNNSTPKQRLKNYSTYGGIKIIFACKYDNFSNIETSLHIYFGDFFDTNVDGNEWFDFSKKSNQEFIYRISPLLLTSSIELYKDSSFDYSNEFWEKFDNWLKQHSDDNCKKYNSFLKNKNYLDYREFVLKKIKNSNEEFHKQQNKKLKQKDKNKICEKYEKKTNRGRTINWNLFFEHNKQLLGKNVYTKKNKDNVGAIIQLSDAKFGILFKNKQISFNDFCKQNGLLNCCAYDNIHFSETNKTIKQIYEELKWNF